MSFHYDATSDFHTSIAEVETLLTLASSDDTNRTLFLKLSIVSLVTKFQVFVEKILEEFRYQDRFNGTDQTVRESLDFLKELADYIDGYLESKIASMN